MKISGKVIEGDKRGRQIGFPTANIKPDSNENIESGVYAVKVNLNNKQFFGMANIGTRPTFDNTNQIKIEVHIINFNQNIYGNKIEIDTIEFLREEKKFNDIIQLKEQLKKDKEKIIQIMMND